METCFDTFNGWQMAVTVERRLNAKGQAKYYIVPPVTYKEFSRGESRQLATDGHTDGPFSDAEKAFEAAFRDCERDITQEIEARTPRQVERA
jgi:hypothetical protein